MVSSDRLQIECSCTDMTHTYCKHIWHLCWFPTWTVSSNGFPIFLFALRHMGKYYIMTTIISQFTPKLYTNMQYFQKKVLKVHTVFFIYGPMTKWLNSENYNYKLTQNEWDSSNSIHSTHVYKLYIIFRKKTKKSGASVTRDIICGLSLVIFKSNGNT